MPEVYQLPYHKLRLRLIMLTLLAFFVLTALSGPVRMGLSMVGLSMLVYIPNVMMIVLIGWQIFSDPHERGFSALNLIALLIPITAFVIGMQFIPTIQVAMGIYVLIPFVFGIVCGPVIISNLRHINKFVPWLWVIVSAGVAINYFVTYPWEGFGYSVGSLEVEGSRQWYATGGVKRLAGFSRSSFDAAGHIQILALLFVITLKRFITISTVWLISGAVILLTTTKGMFLVLLVLSPIVLFRKFLPQSPIRALPLFFGVLGFALPASTLMFTYDSQFSNPTLANLTYSYFDRLNYMWPEAWKLLAENGNMFMGRGIGGIGTAQTYFEPSMFNAADNLFLYWFVVFGWAALPIVILLMLRTIKIKPLEDQEQFTIYCLLLAVIVYGMLTNIVENALFGIICGILIRWLAGTPTANIGNMKNSTHIQSNPAMKQISKGIV